MFSKTPKVDLKNQTAQEFINISQITDKGILVSNDNFLFSYIWVKARDNNLLEDTDKEHYFKNLAIALEGEKQAWQIVSIPRVVDINALVENLYSLRRKTTDNAKLNLLNNEIQAIKDIATEGLKEPLIFIKLWQKNGKLAENVLMERTHDLRNRLTESNVYAEIFDKKDVTYICKIYAELGRHQSDDDEDIEVVPVIKQKKKKGIEIESDINLSMLTPLGGLTFKNNKLIVGGTTGRIYAATKFTADLSYDWLVRAVNCTEAITTITFNLSNASELGDALARAVRAGMVDANSTNDARAQKQALKRAEDSDTMLGMLDQKGASIGQCSIVIMPFTDDEDKLDDVCRRVNTIYAANRIKLRPLGQLQQEAFKTISPYYTPDSRILDISERIMPLATLTGGSPMTVNVYKDDNGLYFGRTVDGGIVSLDLLKRGADRTNSNFVVTGKPGTGKSTAIKHIIMSLYMVGTKILLIDPEREYKDLCKNLNGTWIDCGGGKAKINILEVKPVPLDEDDEDDILYQSEESPLANHMRTLEIFFSTYIPSMTDMQKATLKRTLLELYEKFNITWDTDVTLLTPTDFPIMKNLYELLNVKAVVDAEAKMLTALLYDIAEGADSFLWNGHTNIEINSDFVVFDTHRLNNASDNVKRGQYFNIMTLGWDIISRDRDEPVALFCDEAYLMIDPEIPQIMMFLRNISKRCRKYQGVLGVIAHSLVDFLDDRIRAYGQSLLENPTYKLFFGTDGQNLKETTELYDLSESEQSVLMAGLQREALSFIGSQRVRIRFDLPKYKLDLMGKGGGR